MPRRGRRPVDIREVIHPMLPEQFFAVGVDDNFVWRLVLAQFRAVMFILKGKGERDPGEYREVLEWVWVEEDELCNRPFSFEWCVKVLARFSGLDVQAQVVRERLKRGFRPRFRKFGLNTPARRAVSVR